MTNIPVAPAIVNAIAKEIGDKIYDLPAHREHVFMTLQKRMPDES
jgi:CO/xanthine dehydrogenase Mo-binding subunit